MIYNALNDEMRRMTPEARYAAMVDDWKALKADADARDACEAAKRPDVRAENTFSSTLTTQFLVDGAVTKLQDKFAALACFTRDFSPDPYKPRSTAEVKFVTAGATTQKNATNFEQGDSTVSPVTVNVDQYSTPFHVTNDQLNSGLRMDDLVNVNMAGFCGQITSVIAGLMTTANFPLPPIVCPPGNWGWGNMQTAWALLKKANTHNAVLDGE